MKLGGKCIVHVQKISAEFEFGDDPQIQTWVRTPKNVTLRKSAQAV